MRIIQNLLLLFALSQLSACAVISKEECLNNDWRQIGFNVGNDGNIDKSAAFEKRKRACEKHNISANWGKFELGYADGIVDFCQINNAVEIGIKGRVSIIKNNVCPEQDYPGFQGAFSAGYKLYELDTLANEIEADINYNYNTISFKKQIISRINKDLNSKEIDKNQRNQLINDRRRSHKEIKHLSYEIRSYRQHLRSVLYDRDDYADFLYNDYLNQIDSQTVDPRDRQSVYIKKPSL